MTVDDRALHQTLRPLLDLLRRSQELPWPDLASRLEQLVGAAVTVLRVDSVGLMLLDDADHAQAAGFSDELAAALEEAQTDTGQGPGIETLSTGATVAVEDVASRVDYARLWTQLAPTGLRAVLSSPIRAGDDVVGNVNATLRRPHAWTEAQIRANEAYAQVIGLAIGAAARANEASRQVGTLQHQLALSATLGDEDDRE